MEAGKAVYVEKPVSYELGEGWQLVAAAQKLNGVIAAGLQNRSDPGPIEGIKYVRAGNLGAIQSLHICTFRNRRSIGPRLAQPLKLPSTLDYNLWLGPAAEQPIYRQSLHYDWHWDWNLGNGDIGNQGPHEIDLAAWVLGEPDLPKEVVSFGGRFGWDDAGMTPNMHTAAYMHAGVPVIMEVNDMWLSPDRNVPSNREKTRVGIIARCENGILRGGRGGMTAYELDGQTVIQKFPGDGGKRHMANFIAAVRQGHGRDLNAKLDTSVRSAGVAHLANLSYRCGRSAPFAQLEDVTSGNDLLGTILEEQTKQLKDWGIESPQFTLGETVKYNQETKDVSAENLNLDWVQRPGRGEFSVPKYT